MSNAGVFRRAALTAGIMMAWQVAAKTARDSLFLTSFPASSLPAMVAGASITSILLATFSARLLRRFGPFRVIPAGYVLSAALHGVEWLLLREYPREVSIFIYLHVVSFGSVLLSGFWALANERFDPREARKRFGRITGFGTLGGLAGGLLAGWVATLVSNSGILPMLMVFQLACWVVLMGFTPPRTRQQPQKPPKFKETVSRAPYLYALAGLILLVSMSAATLDFLFKAQAVAHYGRGASLSRFFATFYVVSSVASFLAQAGASRYWLDRFGLGRTVATLPVGVVCASLLALLVPSAFALSIARGIELLLRGSLFRSGYELFYTPMPQAEKRTAKTVIDIGADRLGDGLGAGAVQLLLLLPTGNATSAILLLTATMSAAAAWLSFRLDRAYSAVLEKNLVQHAVQLRTAEVEDFTTRSVVMRMPQEMRVSSSGATASSAAPAVDQGVLQLIELRSGDARRIRSVLRETGLLDPVAIPQVIQLLGRDDVYKDAYGALSRSIFRHSGQLVDCLLDESQSHVLRARIPRLLALCDSPVAWDGLFGGLADQRFEIRYRCGRGLDTMLQRHPEFKPEAVKVYQMVGKELAVSRRVWEGRRDIVEGEEDGRVVAVERVLQERASQSLSHVFTLLGLVLPREAVQTAFRAIHTDDARLRALALEFLESSLPRELREPLSAHIEAPAADKAKGPPTAESLRSLVNESPSMVARLEELSLKPPPAGEKKNS